MKLNRALAPERLAPKSIPGLDFPALHMLDRIPTYVVEGGNDDIIKIDIVFKAGTRYEPKPMLSNTCLSMLKEGTERYSAAEIAETVDFYGAQIGTGLSKDRAELSLLCLGKHLEELIEIFIDVALNPVFPEKELEKYKKRSSSALRVNLDKVDFQARLLFSELMFGQLPYRERFATEYYEGIAPEDLKAFFSANYSIDEAFILISGQDTDRAKELLSTALDNKLPVAPPIKIAGAPIIWNYKAERSTVEKADALQSAIRMGAPAVARGHADYPALYIANTALGGYFGSRLMQNIREEKGYTYGIASGLNIFEEAAYISIATQVGAELTEATLIEINKELGRMINEPITPQELELIQHYVAGNLLTRFDGPFAIADRLKLIISSGLEPELFSDFAKAIFQLTPKDVQAAAKKYFQPDGFSIAVVGKG